jgi:hypothetical protein
MKRLLPLLILVLFSTGCVSAFRSITNEIRVPFVSDSQYKKDSTQNAVSPKKQPSEQSENAKTPKRREVKTGSRFAESTASLDRF